MFQSTAYLSYEGFKDNLYHYKYQIVDSDFGSEEWVGVGTFASSGAAGTGACLNCYADKKLNVAFNLYLHHRYLAEKYAWYQIVDEIKYNITYVPKYIDYADEVKRYHHRFNGQKAFW